MPAVARGPATCRTTAVPKTIRTNVPRNSAAASRLVPLSITFASSAARSSSMHPRGNASRFGREGDAACGSRHFRVLGGAFFVNASSRECIPLRTRRRRRLRVSSFSRPRRRVLRQCILAGMHPASDATEPPPAGLMGALLYHGPRPAAPCGRLPDRPWPAQDARVARLVSLALLLALPLARLHAQEASPRPTTSRVGAVKIVVLSTMLADAGIGEWGFAALVAADGHRILFDTGARPDTVLQNARELKVDLAGVRDVVLSHHHGDHTGGLVTLRREYAKADPEALGRAWVGRGIFLPRAAGPYVGMMTAVKSGYEAAGGRFV